jgi:hypothetical protein
VVGVARLLAPPDRLPDKPSRLALPDGPGLVGPCDDGLGLAAGGVGEGRPFRAATRASLAALRAICCEVSWRPG